MAVLLRKEDTACAALMLIANDPFGVLAPKLETEA